MMKEFVASKTLYCVLLLAFCPMITFGVRESETVSNGSVSMFTIGSDMLGLVFYSEKKILLYQVTSRSIALKAVRTWHYDAQFAETIKTLAADGCFPKNAGDPMAAPGGKLSEWFRQQMIEFKPDFKIKGLSNSSGGAGGAISLVVASGTAQGLLVILEPETTSLLLYAITPGKIAFKVCRTLLLDIQIPLFYPSRGSTRPNPISVRTDLKKIEEELNKARLQPHAVKFEVKELQIVKEQLER